jgi:uncharacterized protein (DUF111 family)
MRSVLLHETGSLGVRATTMRRWPQRRAMAAVEIDGQRIGVKMSDTRLKVEFDDAVAAATALELPVRVVIERAVAAAHAASVDEIPSDGAHLEP